MARSKGTGQIISKGKDRWLIRLFRGRDSDGKKLYFNKTVRGSKADAQKVLTAKQREKDTGCFVESSRTTLDEHLDNWLTLVKPRIAEQTYRSYESLLRIHIKPRVGSLRLTVFGIQDAQRVFSSMRDEGLGPRTTRYAHAVLSMAMKKAVELNQIGRNPCDFVELPKHTKKETLAMSPEQAGAFLKAAGNDRMGIVLEFGLVTGMRPEEYLALQWDDIDLSRGTATVQRALIWLKGGCRFGEPKTKGSRRTVPLPAKLVDALRAHRRQQLEHRMKLGAAYSSMDLVFATEIGTPLHYRNLTQRHYTKILAAAGLADEGFVLYSLRHSCATLLLAGGENPKVVAERLGHASVKMTLDTYSHVLPDMQRSASDRLAKMLYA